MMNKLSSLLIVILSLISIPSLAQKQVCLDSSIVAKIIDELIVKDHLQFTVSKLDSTVTVYKGLVAKKEDEIVILKLDKTNYESAINKLNEALQSKDRRITELKREKFIGKVTCFFKGFVIGVAGVVGYIVIHNASK